jgi:hypothetical protein
VPLGLPDGNVTPWLARQLRYALVPAPPDDAAAAGVLLDDPPQAARDPPMRTAATTAVTGIATRRDMVILTPHSY